MQSAFVLTVALVGLCATAAATPLTQETPLFPDTLEHDHALQADFSILLAHPDDGASPDQPLQFSNLVVTFDDSLEIDIPTGAVELSGSVKIPEPPPIGLMALGIVLLTIFGTYRLNYTRQRHRRRRTMRPLTALR
jgi:hypothetical protein